LWVWLEEAGYCLSVDFAGLVEVPGCWGGHFGDGDI
jgi:hypothetical protein